MAENSVFNLDYFQIAEVPDDDWESQIQFKNKHAKYLLDS